MARVKYEFRRKYPHMIGEDERVWNRFIKAYPEQFNEVDYDVRVGAGVSLPDEWTDKEQHWAKQLTQKRIDVVGFQGNFITIVEVKLRVQLGTLGQILGYKYFYEKENNLQGKTSMLVVAEMINKDDSDLLDHYQVKFIIV